jgi:hypothetical protein
MTAQQKADAYDHGYENRANQVRVTLLWQKRYTHAEQRCEQLQSRLQWTLIGWFLTAAFAVVGWFR